MRRSRSALHGCPQEAHGQLAQRATLRVQELRSLGVSRPPLLLKLLVSLLRISKFGDSAIASRNGLDEFPLSTLQVRDLFERGLVLGGAPLRFPVLLPVLLDGRVPYRGRDLELISRHRIADQGALGRCEATVDVVEQIAKELLHRNEAGAVVYLCIAERTWKSLNPATKVAQFVRALANFLPPAFNDALLLGPTRLGGDQGAIGVSDALEALPQGCKLLLNRLKLCPRDRVLLRKAPVLPERIMRRPDARGDVAQLRPQRI